VPDGDERELDRVLAELPQMIGVFEKPRFICHQADNCTQGHSGVAACRGCIEICPGGAVSVIEGRIRIDHEACLGCGLCAFVCPTGAMRCLQASPQDLLVALKGRIAESRLAHLTAPAVIFQQPETDEAPGAEVPGAFGRPALSFPLAAIGCAGPEVWLTALAYGAGQVVVRLPEPYPIRLQNAFAGQLEWVAAILAGLGFSPSRIQLIAAGSCAASDTGFAESAVPPADFPPFQSKRALIRRSVAHLAGKTEGPGGVLSLPAGAPFGSVVIDQSACTLCMACAGVCPTAAFSGPGDAPALRLVESECIQCGQCRKICPERALSLQPRMVLDPGCSGLPQLLYEQEPFACVCCGKPFAPPGLVAKMIERLSGHWMYSREEDIQRLKMCRDCRVRDFFNRQQEGGS
jgi:ferredoxin